MGKQSSAFICPHHAEPTGLGGRHSPRKRLAGPFFFSLRQAGWLRLNSKHVGTDLPRLYIMLARVRPLALSFHARWNTTSSPPVTQDEHSRACSWLVLLYDFNKSASLSSYTYCSIVVKRPVLLHVQACETTRRAKHNNLAGNSATHTHTPLASSRYLLFPRRQGIQAKPLSAKNNQIVLLSSLSRQ